MVSRIFSMPLMIPLVIFSPIVSSSFSVNPSTKPKMPLTAAVMMTNGLAIILIKFLNRLAKSRILFLNAENAIMIPSNKNPESSSFFSAGAAGAGAAVGAPSSRARRRCNSILSKNSSKLAFICLISARVCSDTSKSGDKSIPADTALSPEPSASGFNAFGFCLLSDSTELVMMILLSATLLFP